MNLLLLQAQTSGRVGVSCLKVMNICDLVLKVRGGGKRPDRTLKVRRYSAPVRIDETKRQHEIEKAPAVLCYGGGIFLSTAGV